MTEKIPSVEEVQNVDFKKIIRWYSSYVNPPLGKLLHIAGFDKRIVRAEGQFIYDEEGNKYLDLLSGYGSLNLGHNHPGVLEALASVLGSPVFLQTTINPYVSALARTLAKITPGKLKISFFSNSGAEAVEASLKLARAATKKPVFIYAYNAFHGKTMGALSVSGREKYKKGFEPLLRGIGVPFGDIAALEKAVRKNDVAAFIVEPIQGEAGVVLPPEGYLKEAQQVCNKNGVIFIVDEIQTGFGRTGRLFAVNYQNVEPDIMCLAKSLGGGVMPIGCTIAGEEIWKKAYGSIDRCLLHTSTFGGNTLSAAVALEAVKIIIEERLSERANKLGKEFLDKLKSEISSLNIVKDVRGKGLMIGIEFEPYKGLLSTVTGGSLTGLSEEYTGKLVASELFSKHKILTAFTLNNPNVIRIQAPLIIDKNDIDRTVSALRKTLSSKTFIKLALNRAQNILPDFLSR